MELCIHSYSHDGRIHEIHALSDARESLDGRYVCADITEPGVYFGALFARSYAEHDAAVSSMKAQYAFTIVLYIVALAIGVTQTIHVVRMKEQLMPVKTVILIVSLLYATCTKFLIFYYIIICLIRAGRSVYFILLAVKQLQFTDVVALALFEFPSMLFILMYISILYLWCAGCVFIGATYIVQV